MSISGNQNFKFRLNEINNTLNVYQSKKNGATPSENDVHNVAYKVISDKDKSGCFGWIKEAYRKFQGKWIEVNVQGGKKEYQSQNDAWVQTPSTQKILVKVSDLAKATGLQKSELRQQYEGADIKRKVIEVDKYESNNDYTFLQDPPRTLKKLEMELGKDYVYVQKGDQPAKISEYKKEDKLPLGAVVITRATNNRFYRVNTAEVQTKMAESKAEAETITKEATRAKLKSQNESDRIEEARGLAAMHIRPLTDTDSKNDMIPGVLYVIKLTWDEKSDKPGVPIFEIKPYKISDPLENAGNPMIDGSLSYVWECEKSSETNYISSFDVKLMTEIDVLQKITGLYCSEEAEEIHAIAKAQQRVLQDPSLKLVEILSEKDRYVDPHTKISTWETQMEVGKTYVTYKEMVQRTNEKGDTFTFEKNLVRLYQEGEVVDNKSLIIKRVSQNEFKLDLYSMFISSQSAVDAKKSVQDVSHWS